jgi:hypothetical protein
MQTTLRIRDDVYREAKADAARLGLTLTRYIEEALQARLDHTQSNGQTNRSATEERDRLMESLLQATAHFRVGARPTREEMHER